jgi:hypothetical protein
LVVGGWALFISGSHSLSPLMKSRTIGGSTAWTITYLATTLLSLWAALTLKGRDRMAWGFFAAASGSWFVTADLGLLRAVADISTPFRRSPLFYLLFAPLCAVA